MFNPTSSRYKNRCLPSQKRPASSPPGNELLRPQKGRRIVFQPPSFRGEMLFSGRVIGILVMVYYIINQIHKQVGVEPPNSKSQGFLLLLTSVCPKSPLTWPRCH